MPDVLNKQAIVNLLIDSPLREPIKINLIDIVNNTAEADLPKVYSTITKELEIFQKATERRMKLAEETIAKLSGVTPTELAPSADTPTPSPINNPMPILLTVKGFGEVRTDSSGRSPIGVSTKLFVVVFFFVAFLTAAMF